MGCSQKLPASTWTLLIAFKHQHFASVNHPRWAHVSSRASCGRCIVFIKILNNYLDLKRYLNWDLIVELISLLTLSTPKKGEEARASKSLFNGSRLIKGSCFLGLHQNQI